MASPVKLLRQQVGGFRISLEMIVRFRHELWQHWPRLLLAVLCALGYTAARLA